jgi:hypothetical protein
LFLRNTKLDIKALTTNMYHIQCITYIADITYMLLKKGKQMEITDDDFLVDHYSSEKKGNYTHGHYAYHSIEASTELTVDGHKMWVNYQTGNSFDYNDYNYPTNSFELYEENSDYGISLINRLYEIDFENEEYINEKLLEINKELPVIKTIDDLEEVYKALIELQKKAQDILNEDKFSSDLDDFDEDDCGCGDVLLTLNKKG